MRILCLSCVCVFVAGCGLNDSVCGCATDNSVPTDLEAHFEELESLCAGTFTGYIRDHGGTIVCRYDWKDYVFEAHYVGEPTCFADGEDADCDYAAAASVDLLGELVVGDETYEVTGYAEATGLEDDEVLLECFYFVTNPNPGELPALEESGGEGDAGVTSLNWRHEDQMPYPDWEYCSVVMEEHLPPE